MHSLKHGLHKFLYHHLRCLIGIGTVRIIEVFRFKLAFSVKQIRLVASVWDLWIPEKDCGHQKVAQLFAFIHGKVEIGQALVHIRIKNRVWVWILLLNFVNWRKVKQTFIVQANVCIFVQVKEESLLRCFERNIAIRFVLKWLMIDELCKVILLHFHPFGDHWRLWRWIVIWLK